MGKRLGICILVAAVMLVAGCERNRLYDNTSPFSLYTFLGYDFGPAGLEVINVDSPNLDGTYLAMDLIEITVQFEDVVLVDTSGGIPDILLATSPLAATAQYTGGSGTDTLHFGFTVQTGQNSSDLDYLNVNSLRLNGGAITDLTGTPVSLLLPNPGSGFPGMGSLSVNRDLMLWPGIVPPSVTTVTSPTPNGRYGGGYTVEIRVVYDVAVFVNTAGGTPRLRLNTAPWPAVVPYSSGSGTTTLRFLYTVAAGESSGDLDQETVNALELNGGIITDTVYGTNADVVLPAPGLGATLAELKNIEIDAVPPGNVSGLSAVPGDGSVTIAWTNPGDADFAGVRILRRDGAAPAGPFDPLAAVVCVNCGSPTVDSGLTNGTPYFFMIYAYDTVVNPGANFSTGVLAAATPVPDGRFVIVGQAGQIRRAEDPAGTWTIVTSGTSQNFNAVASNGGGELLAVGNGGNLRYSSDDGASWQDKSNATVNATTLLDVIFGNGWWVAVGQGGNLFYTTDIVANTWISNSQGGSDLNGVAFGNNVFVTVGANGVGFRTTDPAIAWGSTNGLPAATLNDVAFGNGEFVAVGSDPSIQNRIYLSPDNGTTFFDRSFHSLLIPYYGVCSSPSWWVLVGEEFLDYGPSPLGAASFQDGGAPGGSGTLRAVAFGVGYYVAVGDGGLVRYAADPTDFGFWTLNQQSTINWTGVAFSR